MDCQYKAHDIAMFLYKKDLLHSSERKLLKKIWEQETDILEKYKENFNLFLRDVHFEISKLDGSLCELEEINQLAEELDYDFYIDLSLGEEDAIKAFFKNIKLNLKYIEGKMNYKFKIKDILLKFGYKRRSNEIILNFKQILDSLKLKTYTRRHIPCDIAEIKSDDMVIIKLN